MALIGGFGGLIGVLTQSIFKFQGMALLAAVIVLTVLVVAGMWLLMTLRPVDG